MREKRDQRPFNVAYYARNRAREIERVTSRQRATLEFLRELRRVPCVDCHGSFEPHQMDFDHRDPSLKSFTVASSRAMLKQRDVLITEIAKCDIVCANCHRVRTYGRFLQSPPRNFIRKAIIDTTRAQRRRDRFREKWSEQVGLLRAFRKHACTDCGRRLPWYAMEFDHREPGIKCFDVTRKAGRVTLLQLLEELEKCDVVCANCHRSRTFRRRLGRSA